MSTTEETKVDGTNGTTGKGDRKSGKAKKRKRFASAKRDERQCGGEEGCVQPRGEERWNGGRVRVALLRREREGGGRGEQEG
jgi:hypothetical protein